MSAQYEVVHTVTDYWDGPRRGIADFRGQPHVFESRFDKCDENDHLDTFFLAPIDEETFRLALEDWKIWRRWVTAFHLGQTDLRTHPALADDRERHIEIKRILNGKLMIHRQNAIQAHGEFRRREDPTWNGKGQAPLEVRWTAVTDAKALAE